MHTLSQDGDCPNCVGLSWQAVWEFGTKHATPQLISAKITPHGKLHVHVHVHVYTCIIVVTVSLGTVHVHVHVERSVWSIECRGFESHLRQLIFSKEK